MTNVNLIGLTKPSAYTGCHTAQELVAYAARVSNPTNQNNTKTAGKLVKYLVDNKHFSPLEMVHVVMSISTTRDISRQILRHRSFSFQEFCVDENTLITTTTKSGHSKKVKIKDLYKRQQSPQYSKLSDNLVRVWDAPSQLFVSARIKEVFDTGIKPVYKILLENGKELISTLDHKILTNDGFKRLENIDTSCFVACNGVPVYQNKDWLNSAKQSAILSGTGLNGIAELAKVKPVTITKWLRKHNLQFLKQEVATYTTIWNKGLPQNQQPRFNKPTKESTRAKQRLSARANNDSNLFSSGKSSRNTISFRAKVAQYCKGYHLYLLHKQNFLCPISGEVLDKTNSEVDHILPVYARPDLAFDVENLQVISKNAHSIKTQQETLSSKYTVRFSKVSSITFVGNRQTYDMEIDHIDHNYVAGGIVTHNSQRYAVSENFVTREARLQDTKNRQNSIETDSRILQEEWNIRQLNVKNEAEAVYKWALNQGIAKEQARVVLPEGMTETTLYMAGTLRSWLHYCSLRMDKSTQKEHREIAYKCWDVITTHFPDIAEAVKYD